MLGLDFYRSTNGGGSWSSAAGSMHVDHHGLAFGPGASPVIYDGNDGGVYRCTNGGTVWTLLPEQPVTQVYRLALDASNANALLLGAQDNGTNRSTSGAANDFVNIYGGDGFGPLVHPAKQPADLGASTSTAASATRPTAAAPSRARPAASAAATASPGTRR